MPEKLQDFLAFGVLSRDRTYELTSSIVPRGTSFHHSVELDCSPIAFDPARLSCRYDFPGPAELGAVNPYAVHDHGQPARQRHDRLFHPAAPGCKYAPNIDPTSSSAHPVDIVRIFRMGEEPAPALVATPHEAQKTVLD